MSLDVNYEIAQLGMGTFPTLPLQLFALLPRKVSSSSSPLGLKAQGASRACSQISSFVLVVRTRLPFSSS